MEEMKLEGWARETRQAWRQVHAKRQARGHCTKKVPWTWAEFRKWFKAHLEKGVQLGLNERLSQRDWDELRKACLRGMMLPSKAPF